MSRGDPPTETGADGSVASFGAAHAGDRPPRTTDVRSRGDTGGGAAAWADSPAARRGEVVSSWARTRRKGGEQKGGSLARRRILARTRCGNGDLSLARPLCQQQL